VFLVTGTVKIHKMLIYSVILRFVEESRGKATSVVKSLEVILYVI
jgi:hypothetical protein